jgi:hypothetical protein
MRFDDDDDEVERERLIADCLALGAARQRALLAEVAADPCAAWQPASVEIAVDLWRSRLAGFSLSMLRLQLQELQEDVDLCDLHTVH